jgi:release factor glutamine methyltransferase
MVTDGPERPETYGAVYRRAKRMLADAGVESPGFDAACLLEKHTGVARGRLPIVAGEKPGGALGAFWADVARRAAREPLQYLLGEWEFMGLRFAVGPGVLIPRPDTELLAETAVSALRGKERPVLVELCAGSGCVSVAAAVLLPACTVYSLELSDEAAGYLRRNCARHGVEERVHPVKGDMLDPGACAGLPGKAGADALICNPPYIPSGEIASLQPEVARHEPRLALDGGPDGLTFYRAAGSWFSLLHPGGLAAFEVGAGQARAVAALFEKAGLADVRILKDCGGVERVVAGKRAG